MTRIQHTNRTSSALLPGIGVALLVLLSLSGCFSGSKPAQLTEQYTLEYAPPEAQGTPVIQDFLRIERFSVAQAYNNQSMLYRPAPYQLAAYTYNRWRVTPGDMVTDYLVRYARDSGIFLGIFSYRDIEATKYALEGGIEEFLEVDEGKAGKAFLAINVSLVNARETDSTKRLLLQKSYRNEEPLREQAPTAYAEGMSAALKRMSGQILKDVRETILRTGR